MFFLIIASSELREFVNCENNICAKKSAGMEKRIFIFMILEIVLLQYEQSIRNINWTPHKIQFKSK